MTFIQYVLREVNCPRCNAIAQERIEDRERNVIIVLWCDKCKLKRHIGVTTRKALALRKRQTKLRNLANQTRNPHDRNRLLKQAELLEQQIRQAEIGI